MSNRTTQDLKELKKLGRDQIFEQNFRKLCLNLQLEIREKEYLLSCALLFFQYYNQNKKFKGYFKIGFYILLKYGIQTRDFKPLYEISLQVGFYPIINHILNSNRRLYEVDSKNRLTDVLAYVSFRKTFTAPEKYIESYEQTASREKIIRNNNANDIAYIAPTSYGKSSLIKEFIKSRKFKRIAVIVPSKSLLVQTYNDLKTLNKNYKLILHDEMYNGEQEFIGILTQERATRLLNKNPNINFEVIFIDEAHKILDRDLRSFILSRLIQLNYQRNEVQKLIYLSPLVESESNLKVKKTTDGEVYTQRIQHDFKSFELYYYDKGNWLFYDRFTDQLFELNRRSSYFSYIIQNSKNKNFVFHSRPVKVESLAKELSRTLKDDVSDHEAIKKIANTLKNEVHKSFYAVTYISKGIIYIHAKIPNIIKEYLEDCFKKVPQIKYVIANSVILEGVNMPIDTIFITTNGTGNRSEILKVKDLINLVGRANRLNEVFHGSRSDIDGLISKIHFLNSSEYQGKRPIISALKALREYTFQDVVKNPLIQTYDIDKITFSGDKQAIEKKKIKMLSEDAALLEFSEKILQRPENLNERLHKYIIENALDRFFVNLHEVETSIIGNMKSFTFRHDKKVVDILNDIFVKNNINNIKDYELERLKEEKARNYYNYFLKITQKQHLNERINDTVKYFELKAKSDDPYLYIGTAYGEEARATNKYQNTHYNDNVYINLNKEEDILVNIAIVKLKMEEDFVSYKLNPLIVFLYEFNIIPEEYYYEYIYGTTDRNIIKFVRFGLSVGVISKLMEDGQISNLDFDNMGNLVVKNQKVFDDYMILQPNLFQFEIHKFLN